MDGQVGVESPPVIEDIAKKEQKVLLIDPSELYRPEKKDEESFRQYYSEDTPDHVKKTYYDMHMHQTLKFVKERMDYWLKFDKFEMTIFEMLDKLEEIVDESDPDVDVPNIYHAFQTAERVRKAHPDHDWFHVTALVHDLGKVMALYGEPQWAVVGDTFVVGCAPADTCVYYPHSFHRNPDWNDPRYNTAHGVYEPHCGLDRVHMSWGHDEYLYRCLVHNGSSLPEEGLKIIRYHSCYPWHSHGAYRHLCDNKDEEMVKWVKEFNKFDLYSKSDDMPNIEALKPYYQSLIDKYMPGKLRW